MFKKILMAMVPSWLVACSALTVPSATPSEGPEWSGTIPPLYWRWENEGRQNAIIPLAVFDDQWKRFYSPLVGWSVERGYQYYLTPLFNRSSPGDGVTEWHLPALFCTLRTIDREKHPESSMGVDGGIYPLWSWLGELKRGDNVNSEFSVLYSAIIPFISGYYERMERTATGEEKQIGVLTYSDKESTTKFGDEVSGAELKVTEGSRSVFPFWWRGKINEEMSVNGKFGKYEEESHLILPNVYVYSRNGERFDIEKEQWKRINLRQWMVLPLFQYELRDDRIVSTNSLFYLWSSRYDRKTEEGKESLLFTFYRHNRSEQTDAWDFLFPIFRYESREVGSRYALGWRILNWETTPGKGRFDLFFIPLWNEVEEAKETE